MERLRQLRTWYYLAKEQGFDFSFSQEFLFILKGDREIAVIRRVP